MQPVLETRDPDGFSLWPVAEGVSSRFTALSGNLTSAEVGTALMLIARCNDIDPDPGAGDDRPPRPADPLGSFLHGLLTFEDLFAAGGLRVVDGSTGVTLLPGCCNGLEDWRDVYSVLDGTGWAYLGHDPDPVVELSGDRVRLVVDFEQSDSPVIELSAVELRRLLDGVGRDLADFLALAADWARFHLPQHAEPVIDALVRVLPVPANGGTRTVS
ncbi:hypothetical protein OG333_15485 [Streptomyces anulatus]|uniref:hypothetical protein n=1 Tax=Streptomyces anulatus TaxID=1892 RepID=UPI00386EED48|nr:hypothetical protein OG333_15485 [Streptomyces anulatus]